ncbi:MAG: BREX-1 system adenine-specific DNA-methyltransferase PglX, partial [Patescibacteria group bacterium]|nr:BREX-1 system adenine-specific DNA-methyltransferase PglX [Patescibacteria group bacterium]
DGRENLSKAKKYIIKQSIYKEAPNNVIFIPTDYNIRILENFGKIVNALIKEWWYKISTSKNIEKYKWELEEYRKNLKPGDITLLGLITEGGQGLATANNGKYIGVLEGTKWAEKVRKERPDKLLLATDFCKKNNIKTKQDAIEFLEDLNEKEIRELFDKIKEKYGRDIFGQGWIYRIVSENEIADVENLTDDEKMNGIKGKRTFVPYDKGDKEGNRWYAPTPYYIDWSRENVKALQTDPKARWQGYQFYFREGFCWNNVTGEKIICRLKEKSVHSTEAMTFISVVKILPDFFLVCLLNSNFFSYYKNLFLNVTVHLTTGDAKEFPIIIPTATELAAFEKIFNRAYTIQKQKFAGTITEAEAERELEEVQRELDKMVEEMYMGKVTKKEN